MGMDSDTSSVTSSTVSTIPSQRSKIQKSTLRYNSSQLSKSMVYDSDNDNDNDSMMSSSSTKKKKEKNNKSNDNYLKLLQSKYLESNEMEDVSPLNPNPKILATPHKPLNEGSRFYMTKRIVIGNVSQFIPPGNLYYII